MDKVFTINELKDKLRPVFDAAPIYKAVLFGSYARGEANEHSDLDIVVDSRGELVGWDIYGVKARVEDAIDKKADMFDLKHYKADPNIFDTAINTGVVIYER